MHLLSKTSILLVIAAITLFGAVSPASAQPPSPKNNLPPCRLDSFVHEAGSQAEAIYGDEGTVGPPPMFGFTRESRIDAGITGTTDLGLTTGHGSYMPSAVGADEFIAPPNGEWSQSGANNGNLNYNHDADALDAADKAEAADPAAAARQASPLDRWALQLEQRYIDNSPFGHIPGL